MRTTTRLWLGWPSAQWRLRLITIIHDAKALTVGAMDAARQTEA